MKQIIPYLNLAGRCKEALTFYQNSLGGGTVFTQTFGESPVEVAESEKHRIMHAEFRAGDIHFMASDGMPGVDVIQGNCVVLSINFTDEQEQEQEQVFASLSEGGNVIMPLENTFWGAKFGQLTDKFGIQWMLNCNKEQSKP